MTDISVTNSNYFLGQIVLYAGQTPPTGWEVCDGTLLDISKYQALFSLLFTNYGGDGRTNFALPDLRGRGPIHQGQGPNLSNRQIGNRGGSSQVGLGGDTVPAHSHDVNVQSNASMTTLASPTTTTVLSALNSGAFTPKTYADSLAPGRAPLNQVIGIAGNGEGHPNEQPYLSMNYIICVAGGMFPPRK